MIVNQIPIVAFVGRSGAGKTTLVEQLVPLLREQGLRVAVIKHDGHDFEIDHAGKDSWRFAQAGAEAVILTSAQRSAVVYRYGVPLPEAARLAGNVDWILVEGWKAEPLCRIGVTRSGHPLPDVPGGYVAVASDRPATGQLPLDDPAAVAAFLLAAPARFPAFDRESGTILPPPGDAGTVLAVCTSEEKGVQKRPVPMAELRPDWGIPGDAHAGNWHRQVSLLGVESVRKAEEAAGLHLRPGDFAENILTEGLCLYRLPVGTELEIGRALCQVTQIGKECHTGCAIRRLTGDCVMPREGIFVRVLRGGTVRPGDAIRVLWNREGTV